MTLPDGFGSRQWDARSRVLAAEARRLAEKGGWETRLVSWLVPDAPAESVAAALGAWLSERQSTPGGTPAGPLAVLLGDTVIGREVATLLAHRQGWGAVLGCTDLRFDTGRPVFVRPVFSGWLEQEWRPAGESPVVATLVVEDLESAGVAELMDEAAGVETVQILDIPAAPVVAGATPATQGGAVAALPRIRRLEFSPPDPRTVDLAHARRVVAVGAGAASDKLLSAARELADLLAGSLGATRPVVDEERLPKERLIGQTGKTVKPDLYLALGLSGSPHHVAGVQKARRIVSINRDPRAPIFGFGDLGFVGELELVLPALVERIRVWREKGGAFEAKRPEPARPAGNSPEGLGRRDDHGSARG